MPSNLIPTGTATRVVEHDSPGLAHFWDAFHSDRSVWLGERWARVVAIQPRTDGAFDVTFEDVRRG